SPRRPREPERLELGVTRGGRCDTDGSAHGDRALSTVIPAARDADCARQLADGRVTRARVRPRSLMLQDRRVDFLLRRHPPRVPDRIPETAALVDVALPYRLLYRCGTCGERARVHGIDVRHVYVNVHGCCRPLGERI